MARSNFAALRSILTGTNAYAGPTKTAEGILQTGSGGSTGALLNTGSITVNNLAGLRVRHADAFSINTEINGFGSAGRKRGTNLGTNNSFSGGLLIISGAVTTTGAVGGSRGAFGSGTVMMAGTPPPADCKQSFPLLATFPAQRRTVTQSNRAGASMQLRGFSARQAVGPGR
jgi:hypothetical protein